MQKRKNMLALMERHREAIKPLDQRMDEFKLAQVKYRKEE